MKIELKRAYYWECPTCKTINYETSCPAEIVNRDYAKDISEAMGVSVEEVMSGKISCAPGDVCCEKCEEEFTAKDTDIIDVVDFDEGDVQSAMDLLESLGFLVME